MSDSDTDLSEYEDIRPFFLPSVWAELCSYEKASYRCCKRNYHAMQDAGLCPRPPQFMSKTPQQVTIAADKSAARKAAASKRKRCDSSDDDANWTPDAERKARPPRRVKFVPPSCRRAKQVQKPAVDQAKETPGPADVKQAEAPESAGGPAQCGPAEQGQGTPSDRRAARYPKRAGSRKSYVGADDDQASDDNELYCDDCEQSWEGECAVHGPLQVIPDTKVEGKQPQRALLTVPPQLAVLESKIKGAGLGVWTKVPVPRRVRFGPYEGVVTPPNKETGYGWEIRRDGKAVNCVDASREDSSNWMRYVNCPRNLAEANLHPFQYKGALYYRTVSDIPANTELLVWYGNSYGKELGIDAKSFKAAPDNPAALNGTFPCPDCNLCFVSPLLLAKHQGGPRCSAEVRRRHAVDSGRPVEAEGARQTAAAGTGTRGRCRTCGAYFKRTWDLKNHLRMHSGEQPFSCTTCGKAFSVSGDLQRHKRTHSGEKPYSCTTCGKAFSHSNALKEHERTHSGEKPYSCTACGKTFARSRNLRTHKRTHSGEKAHSSTTSGTRFARHEDPPTHERQADCAAPGSNPRLRAEAAANRAAVSGDAQGAARASANTEDVTSSSAVSEAPSSPRPMSSRQCSEPVQEAAISSTSAAPGSVTKTAKRKPQTNKAFGCPHCRKRFATKDRLDNHQANGPCEKENRRPS